MLTVKTNHPEKTYEGFILLSSMCRKSVSSVSQAD